MKGSQYISGIKSPCLCCLWYQGGPYPQQYCLCSGKKWLSWTLAVSTSIGQAAMSPRSVLAVTARRLSLGCVDGNENKSDSLSLPHPGIQVDLWSSVELEMLEIYRFAKSSMKSTKHEGSCSSRTRSCWNSHLICPISRHLTHRIPFGFLKNNPQKPTDYKHNSRAMTPRTDHGKWHGTWSSLWE